MTISRSRVIACLAAMLGMLAAPAGNAESGTEDPTVTEKVLEILREQGSIDAEQYETLKREAREESAEAAAAPGEADPEDPEGWTAYWKDGTRIERNDGFYKIKMGGRIQFDGAAIWAEQAVEDFDDPQGTGVDFRRARLFVSGAIGEHGVFKAQYDFAGSDADFKDVYVGLTDLPVGTLLFGHMYEPFSLDQQTSSKYMTFMERALPILAFTNERNSGVRLNDTAFDERMTWMVGGYQDVDDTGEAFEDDANYNVGIRVTGLPVWDDDGRTLVHVGYSYNHEFRDHELIGYEAPPEANTAPDLLTIEDIEADGTDMFGAELATVVGPLSLQGEAVLTQVDRQSGLSDRTFWGAYGQISYFLTGEHRVYDQEIGAFDRVRPKNPFSLSRNQWGAWEIAGRYSHVSLNDGSLRGGIMSSYTVGLNWYLYSNLRFMLNGVLAHLNGVGDTYVAQSRVSFDF